MQPRHRAPPLHRFEQAALAIALGVGVWHLVANLEATTWWRVAVWAVAPDLVFIPIGLAARNGEWPEWGATLYNTTHTHLMPAAVLLAASLLQGHVVWPLLGWFLHIAVDRAIGYDLREHA